VGVNEWKIVLATLCLMVIAVAESPQPAPPAYFASRPEAAEEAPKSVGLGPLVEYDFGDPTAEEQLYLERINRARSRPRDEGFTLATSQDPDIQEAFGFFSVDLQRALDEIALYPEAAPLAFEGRLISAARRHSTYLLQNAIQEHEQRDLATGTVLNTIESRVSDTGYPWVQIGESIYSFAAHPEHGHAAFEIDWGTGDGGVQRPPGHRDNNHNTGFREVGVGIVNGTNIRITPAVTNIVNALPVVTPAITNKVGPQLVTLDFGRRTSPVPLLTGVAYYDVNTNGLYDVGEGIPGIRVEAPQGGSFTTTRRSGGFAVPLGVGTNTVRLQVGGRQLATAAVSAESGVNVKKDLVLPYAGSVVTGPAVASSASANVYSVAEVLGATAYQWTQVRIEPYTTVDGAETGATNFNVSVSPGWNPVRTNGAAVGTRKFQLVHITPTEQILALRPVFRPGSTGSIQFRSMLGFTTVSQVATVDVSSNGGTSWTPVFTQRGWGTNGISQTAYTNVTASLAAFAGTDLRVRFRFRVDPGTYFNQSTASFGWHLDEIRLNGADYLADVATNIVSDDRTFAFQPGRTGRFELRAQPILGGTSLPLSVALPVTASAGAPVGGSIAIDTISRLGDGRLQMAFSLRSGVAGTWHLQTAPAPGGPWLDASGAVLATDAPGRFRFTHLPPAGSGFYRILVN